MKKPEARKMDSKKKDKTQNPTKTEHDEGGGILEIMREWADALVIAFVLAMFARVFVVELFKIPTGSMSPTLLGDWVAYVDMNDDELTDIVVRGQRNRVFVNRGDRYVLDESIKPTSRELRQWELDGDLKPEYDRILVNKFAYWLHNPERGDVVVFKVPKEIWNPAKPIYIKRAVGLPGEKISFDGQLMVHGKRVDRPDFFRDQKYINKASISSGFHEKDYVAYDKRPLSSVVIKEVNVPKDGVYVLGDNTGSSLDSRYWGIVPLDNFKGKAFLRYWPLNRINFIR